jgi:hypothetical protein
VGTDIAGIDIDVRISADHHHSDWNGARDGTRTRGLRRDRAAL